MSKSMATETKTETEMTRCEMAIHKLLSHWEDNRTHDLSQGHLNPKRPLFQMVGGAVRLLPLYSFFYECWSPSKYLLRRWLLRPPQIIGYGKFTVRLWCGTNLKLAYVFRECS